MATHLLRIVPFLLLVHVATLAKTTHKSDAPHKSTLDRTVESVVPKNYDPLERPTSPAKEPTPVHVSIHLSHIEWSFDRLTVVMYLRQKWTDHRLKKRQRGGTPVICKPIDIQQHLWFPDIFLSNMIDETKILNPGFVRVTGEGEITYSSLVKSSFACPPNAPSRRLVAKNGEIDCEIDLESFAYSSKDVDLKWMSENQAATVDDAYNELIKVIGTGEMNMQLSRGTYTRLTLNLTLDTGLNGDQMDLALRRFYGR